VAAGKLWVLKISIFLLISLQLDIFSPKFRILERKISDRLHFTRGGDFPLYPVTMPVTERNAEMDRWQTIETTHVASLRCAQWACSAIMWYQNIKREHQQSIHYDAARTAFQLRYTCGAAPWGYDANHSTVTASRYHLTSGNHIRRYYGHWQISVS